MKPGTSEVTLTATPAGTPQGSGQGVSRQLLAVTARAACGQRVPGTGPQGNGVGPNMLSQNVWINSLKSDCNFCHQLGNRLTRSVDHVLKAKPD
jgi:hypothetical protein